MDLPKRFARRGIVLYFQIAAAIVSILLGLAQITKESQPLVQKIQENQHNAEIQRQKDESHRKAQSIAQMNISWQYRGNDGVWRYYSDTNGRFWARTNIQGTYEYSERPPQIAVNPELIR